MMSMTADQSDKTTDDHQFSLHSAMCSYFILSNVNIRLLLRLTRDAT